MPLPPILPASPQQQKHQINPQPPTISSPTAPTPRKYSSSTTRPILNDELSQQEQVAVAKAMLSSCIDQTEKLKRSLRREDEGAFFSCYSPKQNDRSNHDTAGALVVQDQDQQNHHHQHNTNNGEDVTPSSILSVHRQMLNLMEMALATQQNQNNSFSNTNNNNQQTQQSLSILEKACLEMQESEERIYIEKLSSDYIASTAVDMLHLVVDFMVTHNNTNHHVNNNDLHVSSTSTARTHLTNHHRHHNQEEHENNNEDQVIDVSDEAADGGGGGYYSNQLSPETNQSQQNENFSPKVRNILGIKHLPTKETVLLLNFLDDPDENNYNWIDVEDVKNDDLVQAYLNDRMKDDDDDDDDDDEKIKNQNQNDDQVEELDTPPTTNLSSAPPPPKPLQTFEKKHHHHQYQQHDDEKSNLEGESASFPQNPQHHQAYHDIPETSSPDIDNKNNVGSAGCVQNQQQQNQQHSNISTPATPTTPSYHQKPSQQQQTESGSSSPMLLRGNLPLGSTTNLDGAGFLGKTEREMLNAELEEINNNKLVRSFPNSNALLTFNNSNNNSNNSNTTTTQQNFDQQQMLLLHYLNQQSQQNNDGREESPVSQQQNAYDYLYDGEPENNNNNKKQNQNQNYYYNNKETITEETKQVVNPEQVSKLKELEERREQLRKMRENAEAQLAELYGNKNEQQQQQQQQGIISTSSSTSVPTTTHETVVGVNPTSHQTSMSTTSPPPPTRLTANNNDDDENDHVTAVSLGEKIQEAEEENLKETNFKTSSIPKPPSSPPPPLTRNQQNATPTKNSFLLQNGGEGRTPKSVSFSLPPQPPRSHSKLTTSSYEEAHTLTAFVVEKDHNNNNTNEDHSNVTPTKQDSAAVKLLDKLNAEIEASESERKKRREIRLRPVSVD